MKRFFNTETEAYTDEAHTAFSELNAALQPIVDKYEKEGFSMRDLFYLLVSESTSLTLGKLAGRKRKKRENT